MSVSLYVPLAPLTPPKPTLTYSLRAQFQASIRKSEGERVSEVVRGRGRQTGFEVQVHVEKMTEKTARRRLGKPRADMRSSFFFPKVEVFAPEFRRGGIEQNEQRKSKARRWEQRQENVFRPPPLNAPLRLTPPPVTPLAFFLYLSFPFPSHLLMRSLAYTCAFTASLSFSLCPSPAAADLLGSPLADSDGETCAATLWFPPFSCLP